jgi:hypothetical protein
MSLPPPPLAVALGPLNPIEALIAGLNTNTYLIGLAMILLNLGGRHLSMGLTPEQDRFFQAPWMRRAMLFVVIFVATRNIFTALWLSVALILVIGYLFNEHSDLYLFGDPVPLPPPAAPATPLPPGLTGEEQEILKRLQDKSQKLRASTELAAAGEPEKKVPLSLQLQGWYKENMTALRTYIN